MKIGDLARATGAQVETIRYYERIGVIRPAARTAGNYRDYGTEDVERLAFIRHARGLGFDLNDVRSLMDLAEQPERDCCEVDEIASRHLRSVEEKMARLERLRDELKHMLNQCTGGRIASCHILETLGDHSDCDAGHRAHGD